MGLGRDAGRTAGGRRRRWRPAAGRSLTANAVDVALQCVPAPSRVLVLSCGTGELARRLASASPTALTVVGVDHRPAAIRRARATGADDRVRFDVGRAEELRYPDRSFDLVVCPGAVTRWRDPERGLAQCARLLAPGGRLVVAGRTSVGSWVAALVGQGAGAGRRRKTERLLSAGGFASIQWHECHRGAVRAASAVPMSVWCPTG
jgi:ubiquinone/menaquinone biosynthesis C-methylase UbiE